MFFFYCKCTAIDALKSVRHGWISHIHWIASFFQSCSAFVEFSPVFPFFLFFIFVLLCFRFTWLSIILSAHENFHIFFFRIFVDRRDLLALQLFIHATQGDNDTHTHVVPLFSLASEIFKCAFILRRYLITHCANSSCNMLFSQKWSDLYSLRICFDCVSLTSTKFVFSYQHGFFQSNNIKDVDCLLN